MHAVNTKRSLTYRFISRPDTVAQARCAAKLLASGLRNLPDVIYPGGMGWFIANVRGRRVALYTNSGPRFSGVITRYLDDRPSIIILTSVGAGHPP